MSPTTARLVSSTRRLIEMIKRELVEEMVRERIAKRIENGTADKGEANDKSVQIWVNKIMEVTSG